MKTVIITGGNSGLGYHCAKAIAQDPNWHSNWQIVLACRNPAKANQAVQELKNIAKSDQIEAMNLDLASLDSIRSFVAEFGDRNLPPLGAVVCNAGVQFIRRQTYTQEGFETTFGINHLGHFLLVNLLSKKLIPPARIVVVSSDTHDSSKTTGMPAPYWRDPELMAHPAKDSQLEGKKIDELGRIAYTTSKLCNVLFAYELARRLQIEQMQQSASPITVNVFNPGLMPGSGLAQDYAPVAKFVWNKILPILCNFVTNVNTMAESGEALAKLVTNPELSQVTGKYFSGLKLIDSSTESYDRDKAQQLWQKSIELVELKPEETVF